MLKYATRKLESLQESLSGANNNNERLQEVLNRVNEDHKLELSSLYSQHEKAITQLNSDIEEHVRKASIIIFDFVFGRHTVVL